MCLNSLTEIFCVYCVYVLVHVHVCVDFVCAHKYRGGRKLTSDVFLQDLAQLDWLFTMPQESSYLCLLYVRITGDISPSIFYKLQDSSCLCLLYPRVTGDILPSIFYKGAEDWTPVLMYTCRAFYLPNCLLSPFPFRCVAWSHSVFHVDLEFITILLNQSPKW